MVKLSISFLGNSLKKGEDKTQVIGITMDNPHKMEQRTGIFDRSLQDLQRCVNGWSVKPCLGKIFSFSIADDGTIRSAHRLLIRQRESST